MQTRIIMYGQDDPKKCTAAKLVRLGLAKSVRASSGRTLVLDPFAQRTILPADGRRAGSITAIDCSWRTADKTFESRLSGMHRRLPPLLAGNPVNHTKLSKLTTVEALSAALFITGHRDMASELLGKFKWGDTFYALNRELLQDYAKLRAESEIEPLLAEYGIGSQSIR